MVKIIVILIIFYIKSVNVFSQSLINLQEYINKNRITDIGYGFYYNFEENDSLFALNRFINKEMYFAQDTTRDTTFYFSKNNPCRIINKSKSIIIKYNKKKITIKKHSNMFFNDIYLLSYFNDKYLFCSYQIFSIGSSSLQMIDGFLININTMNIIKIPDVQSTPSPLCFTDYDNDGELDYIYILSSVSSNVKFYKLENDKFVNDNRFDIKLLSIDGYVYSIDKKNSILPPIIH